MAKPRIRLTTPYDSSETLVFRRRKSWRNSHDITPTEAPNGRGVGSNRAISTTEQLCRSDATLCSSAMTDANDAFTVAERYRPTAINNVRSKYVVYVNSRCASTVPYALAELLVYHASYASAVGYMLSSCVCPSVRLSVTSRSSTKMAKPKITQATPYDNPGTLVLWRQKCRRNSNEITSNGAPNRIGSNPRFSTNISLYLRNGA